MEKANDSKISPREALIVKDLLGFETKSEIEQTAVKTALAKSGKAAQPSWARR